jgi:putative protease
MTNRFDNNKYEVLAPAGSYECMLAAFNAGADAVYVGGQMFGARAFANNFNTEELIAAIDYAHIHNKKLFLTLNTLLKNQEIESQLIDYVKPLYEAGLDAVIVQDFGVLSLVKKHFPLLDIHASTQMTVTGSSFAKELKTLGITRIVPARELSIKEIEDIYKETGLEIECFVHGALCYSYSGMCLLSSLIGGRSGNRGRCAQPCRLPYDSIFNDKSIKGEYPLSPKDLCTLKILPKILKAGVYSLKIEGRMKKPEYVASVTAMYRKYVDMFIEYGEDGYRVSEDDIKALMDIYNRGGFTDGYYNKHNGREIMSLERPNHMGVKVATVLRCDVNKGQIVAKSLENISSDDVLEIFTLDGQSIYVKADNVLKNKEFTISFNKLTSSKNERIDKKTISKNIVQKTYINRTRNNALIKNIQNDYINTSNINELSVGGSVIIKKDAPIAVNMWYKDNYVNLTGAIPDIAANRPVFEADIFKQFNKTGGTDFKLDKDDFVISLDDGLFVNIKELNQLRREALEKLKELILASYKRVYFSPEKQVVCSDDKAEIVCDKENETSKSAKVTTLVSNVTQLETIISNKNVDIIYAEADIFKENIANNWHIYIDKAHNNHKKLIIALPYITRLQVRNFIQNNKDIIFNQDFDGYMFRNLEAYKLFEDMNIPRKYTVFDNTVYGMNNYSVEFLNEYKPDLITASYELNKEELKYIKNYKMELNVYGYIPVMISAGCIKKSYNKCNKKDEIIHIKDRLGNMFMVNNHCDYCYNVIYNSIPLYIYDLIEKDKDIKPLAIRYNFINESSKEIESILSGNTVEKYTRGHFKRGVE